MAGLQEWEVDFLQGIGGQHVLQPQQARLVARRCVGCPHVHAVKTVAYNGLLYRDDWQCSLCAQIQDVALKAAMTGHLVFSTLHTNDAPSAVTRLVDIGAERFLLSASLLGIIAQRLVRRLCPKCSKARPAQPEERAWLAIETEDAEVREPVGCPLCLGTGYRGRVGLFETLWIDTKISNLIHEGADEAVLAAESTDFRSLYDDSCEKVLAGITTIAEVRRTVSVPARVE